MSRLPYLISKADVIASASNALILFNPAVQQLTVVERALSGGVDSPMVTLECTFFPVSMARKHLDDTDVFLIERGDWTVIPYTRCSGTEIATGDFGGAHCRWN